MQRGLERGGIDLPGASALDLRFEADRGGLADDQRRGADKRTGCLRRRFRRPGGIVGDRVTLHRDRVNTRAGRCVDAFGGLKLDENGHIGRADRGVQSCGHWWPP